MSVQQLDQSRDALSDHLVLDLADGAAPSEITSWGNAARFEFTPTGLFLTGPGFDQWAGHGFFPRVAMSGDFDVSVDVTVKKMQLPAEGGETVLYLETEFQDSKKTAVQVKFALSPEGKRSGEIQVNRLNESGEMQYTEVGRMPASSLHQLRIARRGEAAYFLLQEAPAAEPILLGRFEVGRLPVTISRIRVMAHTAGSGREIVALFKRMEFHAEDVPR